MSASEPAPPPATSTNEAAGPVPAAAPLPDPPTQSATPAGSGRRRWFRTVAGGGAAAAIGVVAWRSGVVPGTSAPPTQAELERATLARVVDRIVPRDETPGAVDLGIDVVVADEMLADGATALVYGQMLAEIDRRSRVEHRAAFLDVDAPRQDALLLALSQSPPDAPGVRGWVTLRQRTMALYWSDPVAAASVGMPRPPQPAGHMDYAEPPQPRARA